eukprot:2647040-Rhodomonas_salina.2
MYSAPSGNVAQRKTEKHLRASLVDPSTDLRVALKMRGCMCDAEVYRGSTEDPYGLRSLGGQRGLAKGSGWRERGVDDAADGEGVLSRAAPHALADEVRLELSGPPFLPCGGQREVKGVACPEPDRKQQLKVEARNGAPVRNAVGGNEVNVCGKTERQSILERRL